MRSEVLSIDDWSERLESTIMINKFRNHKILEMREKISNWKKEFIEAKLEIRYEYEYMKMEYKMLNPLDISNYILYDELSDLDD